MDRVIRGMLTGAAGGLAGALAMNITQTLARRALAASGEPQPRSQRSEQNEPKDRADNPTQRAWRAITRDNHQLGAALIHFLFGAAVGAVYGTAAAYDRRVQTGAGVPFGAAVWLIANEAGLQITGLSRPAGHYSPGTHVFALLSHAVYGAVTDRAVRISLDS